MFKSTSWTNPSPLQPALIKLFLRPTWSNFVATTTLCAYASFLFGWHVHEKAILLVIIPFSLIALNDRRHLGAFRPLAVAGHVSLFPLLFTASEFPVKVAYTIFWLMAFLLAFDRLAPALVFPSLLCSSPYTQPALKMIYHSNFTNWPPSQFS
jgi:alpha-1,3-glucosyltransferase